MSEVLSTFRLHSGDVAPDFNLADAAGVRMSPGDLRGPKGLLVVFACNHCPFVIHLARELGELARGIVDAGVRTVAINPNDAARYPGDAPELMNRPIEALVFQAHQRGMAGHHGFGDDQLAHQIDQCVQF